ncbi:hypothetical protein BU24DRAFT_166913 [Aaosphaeria arxii CBS 175.79]|uniref:Uncharacterized protein n=1 Tax=Aaosphaeria arxii CBS 175.79 TaxID=1450172 RepID=A0A6A5XYE7_9PLEO|nr:uncharacterized protein BU24DRAFT_166913 [Aaosphaeria arxii CBS 175.79]KAF2018192.1 hypothetical protein BU24DRAFT_166913 [Aaosphaeria arxii CBS 175.79]
MVHCFKVKCSKKRVTEHPPILSINCNSYIPLLGRGIIISMATTIRKTNSLPARLPISISPNRRPNDPKKDAGSTSNPALVFLTNLPALRDRKPSQATLVTFDFTTRRSRCSTPMCCSCWQSLRIAPPADHPTRRERGDTLTHHPNSPTKLRLGCGVVLLVGNVRTLE